MGSVLPATFLLLLECSGRGRLWGGWSVRSGSNEDELIELKPKQAFSAVLVSCPAQGLVLLHLTEFFRHPSLWAPL